MDDDGWDEGPSRGAQAVVFVLLCVAMVLLGMALGFVLDWLGGRF